MYFAAIFFIIAALGLGSNPAPAQNIWSFTVDGEYREDWGQGFHLDSPYDVVPDTNSTVNIRQYGYGYGEYGAPPKRELFAFIFKFMAPPFQGSDPTTVDLYFDVSADTTFGDLTAPWRGFRPEHRFTVTGQGGRLTKESYRRYTGGQWNAPTEGTDIPELEVALGPAEGRWAGQCLEGAIPWSVLGSPGRHADPKIRTYSWAVQVSQGTYREYVPDERSTPNPWDPLMHYFTNIKAQSWGKVKKRYD